MNKPWLKIIGISEHAPFDMSEASISLINEAEFVFGGKRHLKLLGVGKKGRVWPIPFSVRPLLAKKNKNVVVLASGDPFWFGVGGTLSKYLDPTEWYCIPGPSIFSLVASRLGWRIEETVCLGLHNKPIQKLVNYSYDGQKIIALCKNETYVKKIRDWFANNRFGESDFFIFERLGGKNERVSHEKISKYLNLEVSLPVVVAIKVSGQTDLITTAGLPNEMFVHDGQITKKHMRAITMAELAPKPGELLWDLGAGSGSISIEWARLSDMNSVIAFERDRQRLKNMEQNICKFGLDDQIEIILADLPNIPNKLRIPDAVFIGGGVSEKLLKKIWSLSKPNSRIVVNSVTLEAEQLLLKWKFLKGGSLTRINLSTADKIGEKMGWRSSMPILQWSIIK